MTTLAALKEEIALEIVRPDLVANGAVANAISGAIRHYRRKRFYFNVLDSIDLSTVAGQSDYTAAGSVPTKNITRIDNVFRVESDGTTELERKQPAVIELLLSAAHQTGKPCFYAYTNRELRLAAKPDAIYTIRIFGQVWIDGPATDDEANNPWMTDAYDLIKYRAKASLYAEYMEEDGARMAQMMAAAEAEQFNALVKETFDRTMTGFIEPTEF